MPFQIACAVRYRIPPAFYVRLVRFVKITVDIASLHLHYSAGDGQDVCICPSVVPVEIIPRDILETQAAASVHNDDKIRGSCGKTCGFRPFDRTGILTVAWYPAECIGIQAVT